MDAKENDDADDEPLEDVPCLHKRRIPTIPMSLIALYHNNASSQKRCHWLLFHFVMRVITISNFDLLVLFSGLHHNKVPLVVQPFVKVVVMSLYKTQISREYGVAC